MIPLRSYMNTRKPDAEPAFIHKLFSAITALHMLLCLGFLSYSLVELTHAEDDCWKPFTWLYLNYYLLILIVIGPAMTLGIIIGIVIICSPCVAWISIKKCRTERANERNKTAVVDNLAKIKFDPSKFKAQSDCVICLESFNEGEMVTPLPCSIKHYFHSKCIESWMKT
jgi:hypothetical protein